MRIQRIIKVPNLSGGEASWHQSCIQYAQKIIGTPGKNDEPVLEECRRLLRRPYWRSRGQRDRRRLQP